MSLNSEEQNYIPTLCTIDSVTRHTELEKTLRITLPGKAKLGHRSGQFVQVSLFGIGEAPISISSSPTRGNHFEITVRKIGKVTNAAHELKAGDTIGIRGPFGSYFDFEKIKGKEIIMIAGGLGLAPMRSVIQYLADNSKDFKKLTIVYGTKSSDDILYPEEISEWKKSGKFEFHETVDYGTPEWKGNVGLITKLIPPLNFNPAETIAIIIGPPVMYKYVILELDKKNLPHSHILVSLERYMKCGVGKCGHCTIEHLYCCMQGPVFWYNEVENLKGAI